MFCYQCGAKMEDGLNFCTNCGAKLAKDEPAQAANAAPAAAVDQPYIQSYTPNVEPNGYAQNTQNNAVNDQKTLASPMKATFFEAIKLFFINYANFTGRSTVSEYWWAYLFNYLASLVLSFIPYVGTILSLALIVPGISISVRRLHDIGKPWTYLFMSLIPIAGPIILIVYYCKRSDADNQWGPASKN